MKIQTTITVDKDWQREFEKDDVVIEHRVAFHISIDPITGIKNCTIYTDDGRGNGLPIIQFEMY